MLCKELQCQSTLHGTIEEYIPFQNVEECVKEADVIVTTTSATTPLIHHKWVKPGVHINGKLWTKSSKNNNRTNSDKNHKLDLITKLGNSYFSK